jgi:hypothetical protein
MSDFRIFCFGVVIGNIIVGVTTMISGQEPRDGITASIFLVFITGATAVMVFGRKSNQ